MLLRSTAVRRCTAALDCRARGLAGRANSSRGKVPLALAGVREPKSEWWAVDGEAHEVGDGIPPRERFVIPRDNIPNRRRKQLREQFMRRTRLVLKESDQESWCKRYMELYQELRENWERLYWDEGYSKKIAEEHANYESAEDDDADFSPYRRRSADPNRARDSGFGRDNQDPAWERVRHVRDKFEFDRERRMREKAFAPMNVGRGSDSFMRGRGPEPFDARRFAPRFREDSGFNPVERSTTQEPFDPKRFFPGN